MRLVDEDDELYWKTLLRYFFLVESDHKCLKKLSKYRKKKAFRLKYSQVTSKFGKLVFLRLKMRKKLLDCARKYKNLCKICNLIFSSTFL